MGDEREREERVNELREEKGRRERESKEQREEMEREGKIYERGEKREEIGCSSLSLSLSHRPRNRKTLLLFCIRDHVKTPLEKLKEQILTDMKAIWTQLQKARTLRESWGEK